jgi:hypothetical protein
MKGLFLVLLAAAAAFSLSGSFECSWSRVQFVSDQHPWLSDNFSFYRVGSTLDVSPFLGIIVRTGYGTAEPSDPPEPVEGSYVSDARGRLWTIEGGARAGLPGIDAFFLRGTAGAACVLLDYDQGTSEYSFSRRTESSWDPQFSVGLGTRFDLDFLPVLSYGEFALSLQRTGSYNMISGEVALGI